MCGFGGRHRVLFVCTESHRQVKKEEINLSSSKTCNCTGEEERVWFNLQQCRSLQFTEFISDLLVSDLIKTGPIQHKKKIQSEVNIENYLLTYNSQC